MSVTYYNTYLNGKLMAVFYDETLVKNYIEENKKCTVDRIQLGETKRYYEYTEIHNRIIYALRFKNGAFYKEGCFVSKENCFVKIENGYVSPQLGHFCPSDYSTFEKHKALDIMYKFPDEKLEIVQIKLSY